MRFAFRSGGLDTEAPGQHDKGLYLDTLIECIPVAVPLLMLTPKCMPGELLLLRQSDGNEHFLMLTSVIYRAA